MANSQRTTNFGPIVSLATSKADARAPHLFLDSNTTLTVAGVQAVSSGGALNVASGGTLDIQGVAGIYLSGATSASLDSTTLPDGYLSVGSVSVTSATIYFRSGNTTYEFDAQASGVL